MHRTTCERTHVVVLSGEDYDLIELGHVGKEVVNAWTLRCPPTMLTLRDEDSVLHKIWYVRYTHIPR